MTPTPALRGRDAELAVIGERLAGARAGHGSTIFIEGPGGFGKIRLLAETAAMAGRVGVQVGTGAVDARDRLVPIGVLIGALFDGSPPLLDRGALRDLHTLPEQRRYWLLQDLEALLEWAAGVRAGGGCRRGAGLVSRGFSQRVSFWVVAFAFFSVSSPRRWSRI